MLDPNLVDISGDEDVGNPSEPVPPSDPTNPPDPLPILSPVFPSVGVSDGVIGDPTDSQYGDVQWSNTSCAVVAAGGVIHAMTGIDYPESVLIAEAKAQGLYDAGTIPENFGKLLGVYEIPYHVNESGAMQDIVKELAYGRKVLVAIDGPELWGKALGGWVGEVLDWIQENIWTGGNHAVWITSIDVSDPSNITVTLNDSGQLEGVGKTYSLEEFVDAAEDSRFHYVATSEAAPGTFQGGAPDPDLASFPEIKDYYEIRYSEVLPVGVEGTLAAFDSIGSESGFDIEQMRLSGIDKVLLTEYVYPVEKFLQDRGLMADPEVMIREYAKWTSESVEEVRERVEDEGLDFVHRKYVLNRMTRDFADNFGHTLKYLREGVIHSGPWILHRLWVIDNFQGANTVGEICSRFGELGFEVETYAGATYEDVVSHINSTGSPALMTVDWDELKITNELMRQHFWEKFREVMDEVAPFPSSSAVLLFIPAVLIGVLDTIQAAFDIFGNSPDDLVQVVEFTDDMVNVRWQNGDVESFSHAEFEIAFEDSNYSYILLKP